MGNSIRTHGAVIVIATSPGFSIVGIASGASDAAGSSPTDLPARLAARTAEPGCPQAGKPTGAAPQEAAGKPASGVGGN